MCFGQRTGKKKKPGINEHGQKYNTRKTGKKENEQTTHWKWHSVPLLFAFAFYFYLRDWAHCIIKDLLVSQIMLDQLVFLSIQAINTSKFKTLGRVEAGFEMSWKERSQRMRYVLLVLNIQSSGFFCQLSVWEVTVLSRYYKSLFLRKTTKITKTKVNKILDPFLNPNTTFCGKKNINPLPCENSR